MKIWFRIVICPSVIFFPDIFATIPLIHKQIIAVAGYYACGVFFFFFFFLFYHEKYILCVPIRITSLRQIYRVHITYHYFIGSERPLNCTSLPPAMISRTSLSRTRLFRITAYLEVKIWSLF